MARGNLFQGQASGKLGDSVLMVRNGQQLARVYTTSGARVGKQASEAARIQRVKFGSAANQWGLYKYVCTRMFRKGRKNTQSDYNYFVKRNNQLLPFLTKQENADGVHVLMPGQFSEGNLGRIELVHAVRPDATGTTAIVTLADINTSVPAAVGYSSKVGNFKSALTSAYPNARKVSFLISVPSEIEIEEEGSAFISQFVTHDVVVLDLYEEATPGENDLTIASFFSSKVASAKLKAVFDGQGTHAVSSGNSLFRIFGGEDLDADYISNIGVLIFATNDLASDCYTTILQDSSIPSTAGAYAIWAGYRTQEALRVAADSYGYQSGVMRDDIASVGDELAERAVAYINKVKLFDADLAKKMEKTLETEGVQVRSVRKQVEQEEEKK